MRKGLSLLPAIVGVIAFIYLGGPKSLGAHPWWQMQLLVTGLVGGVILVLMLRYLRLASYGRLAIGAILLVAGFAVARFGGQGFAVSFGDDAFAGSLWFYGWQATIVGFFVLLESLFAKLLRLPR